MVNQRETVGAREVKACRNQRGNERRPERIRASHFTFIPVETRCVCEPHRDWRSCQCRRPKQRHRKTVDHRPKIRNAVVVPAPLSPRNPTILTTSSRCVRSWRSSRRRSRNRRRRTARASRSAASQLILCLRRVRSEAVTRAQVAISAMSPL